MNKNAADAKREMNFELLRIIAMVMVVTLHYWGKTHFLDNVPASEPGFYVAWFFESCCICAVNCYVLLTGSCMCEKGFKISRVLRLWLQVVEYTVILYLVSCLAGMNSFELSGLKKSLLPITNETYWFMTKYLFLLILSPFLNLLIEKCDKLHLGALCGSLLAVFSLLPSIFHYSDFLNLARGYSLPWFVCLYIFGAYIKKFGVPFFASKGKCLAGYFVSVLCIFVPRVIFGILKCYADKDIGYAKELYSYNFVFTLFSALFLFVFLKNVSIKSKGANRIIAFLAPATLGVYLLHLNDYSVKWFFRGILRPERIGNPGLLILHSLVVILAVYLFCAMVEKVRLLILETNPLARKAFMGVDKVWGKIADKIMRKKA